MILDKYKARLLSLIGECIIWYICSVFTYIYLHNDTVLSFPEKKILWESINQLQNSLVISIPHPEPCTINVIHHCCVAFFTYYGLTEDS